MNPRFRNTLVALVVASVTFMELLDATILTTALPTMAQALAVTVIDLKAAITTYLVTLSIFIPISGWVADRAGCKRTLLAAIVLFTASSAACGMAWSLGSLVVFRALQGVGGALMTPVSRLVIVRLFDRSELVRVAGLVAMPIVLGPVVGPLAGGYITTHYPWPWVFYVNVPVGVAAIAAIGWLAPRDEPQAWEPFDARGFLAGGLGLAVWTFVLESLDNHYLDAAAIAGLIVGGTALVCYAVFHCLRSPGAVFDLSLFRLNTFRTGVLQAVVGMLACGGLPLVIAIVLQTQLGYGPLQSGLVLFFGAIGSVAVKPWVSRLIRAIGQRALLALYPLGSAAVLVALGTTDEETSFWQFAAMMFCYGCCQSIFMNMVNAIPFLEIPPERLSKATSLQGTVAQFSMSLGISFAALVLDTLLESHHLVLGTESQTVAILSDVRLVYWILAGVSLVNSLVGLSLARSTGVVPREHQETVIE